VVVETGTPDQALQLGGSAPCLLAHSKTAQIAAEWHEAVFIPYAWRKCANQAGVVGSLAPGEGGGFFVECDRVGRRAYLKPTRTDPNPSRARAAREKIAADLAYELGVPVPPVVLGERHEHGSDERYVSVSLVMYPRQWSWRQTKGLIPDAGEAGRLVRAALPLSAARGLVFDAWLDQTDHADGHDHNIVFGYDPAAIENNCLIFLDYAMSLGWGGRWAKEGYKHTDPPPFPPFLSNFLDKSVLADTIEAIERFPTQRIEHLVSRIPDTHLAQQERPMIIDGLNHRRSTVRTILKSYLGGSP
jgi:hypothetical protein